MSDISSNNSFERSQSHWNLFQLIMLSSCFMPILTFSKLPTDYYFGSGWTVLCSVVFATFFASPMIHLQFRCGSFQKKSLLTLFDDYLPFTNCFSVATMCFNMLKVMLGIFTVTQCLAYLFFTFYNCDGRRCIGSTYIWGSCADYWSEGDCIENFRIVYTGPIPEEKFLRSFILTQSEDLKSGIELPNWFENNGITLAPYILAWFLIILLTIGGPSIFGLLLYVLAPAAIILLFAVLITIRINYANEANQLDQYLTRFYKMFVSFIPTDPRSLDSFSVQPLVWGFLYTFVHLSQSFQLWSGVFPMLGKLAGPGRITRHLAWLPVLIGITCLSQLPVLVLMFAAASSYDLSYLRCHLGTDWQAPFVMMTHTFSRFFSSRALSSAYFISFLLFLLLTNSFLLLVTVQTIVDHLKAWHTKLDRHPKATYRVAILVTASILICMGFPLITRAGFYWFRLVDWFVDRFMVINVIAQSTGFLVIYARSRGTRWESHLVKTIVIAMFSLLIALACCIYTWYLLATDQPAPDSECPVWSRTSSKDPIRNEFRYLGRLIAAGPFLLGLLIGMLQSLCHVRTDRLKRFKYCEYLWKGEYCTKKLQIDDPNPNHYNNTDHHYYRHHQHRQNNNHNCQHPKITTLPNSHPNFKWVSVDTFRGSMNSLGLSMTDPNAYKIPNPVNRFADQLQPREPSSIDSSQLDHYPSRFNSSFLNSNPESIPLHPMRTSTRLEPGTMPDYSPLYSRRSRQRRSPHLCYEHREDIYDKDELL